MDIDIDLTLQELKIEVEGGINPSKNVSYEIRLTEMFEYFVDGTEITIRLDEKDFKKLKGLMDEEA
jgi:hypothetical protein